jgi:hypothetical protein
MVGAGVPLRTLVNTAGVGAMMGGAVYLSHSINVEGLGPGVFPTLVVAVGMMGVYLAAPLVNGQGAGSADRRGRQRKEPARTIEGQLLSGFAARQSPTGALLSPPACRVSDTASDVHPPALAELQKQAVDQRKVVAEQGAVIALDYRRFARAANGWKMAGFILDPCDDTWREMRANVARVARPGTPAMIEAVVAAARRQWHSGPVPRKKDCFVADILKSPEVTALGTMAPRMDVVRKILDGKHPTLIRAADPQRALGKQPSA